MKGSRLGLAGLVLALVANIPVLAGFIIFAILSMGTRGSVFESLGDLLAPIGPVVPSVIGGLSLLALVFGIAANVRAPGQREGVAAIVISVGTPIVAFLLLFATILL